LQLDHAGGSSDHFLFIGTTLAVSSSPLLNNFCPSSHLGQRHRMMTGEEIESIIDAFAAASKRAVEAGFDAINLSAGGRYIGGQFISPLFNLRTDKWGGTPENRRRFHLEVLRRVRLAVGPNFPIIVKGELKDTIDGGLTLEEGIEAYRQMASSGADAMEITAASPGLIGERPGVNWSIVTGKDQAYARDDAAALKKVVSIPVILNGGIRSFELAQAIVDSGDADMISFGQPFIREQDLIARWQRGDRKRAKCINCDRCWGIAHSGQKMVCGEEASLQDQYNGI
jgi:2,4-dienoyl-CoA reductase-like NADH-dependent reductase (Old Yellow Enzyme family)